MELHSRLNDFIIKNKDTDSFKLAEKFLELLPKKELIKIIADEIEGIRRSYVKSHEKTAFSSEVFERFGHKLTKIIQDDNFTSLMKSNFSLGDGFTAIWGDATVEQHRRRIAYLEKMRGGIDETINRHLKAIEIIEEAKASCLNDALVLV